MSWTRGAFVVVFCVFLQVGIQAQWSEQVIPLDPGWNSVFFEVDPSPRDCDSVFAGIPVESVWSWNRRFTSVEFVQDPNTLLPDQPEWLTWFPANSPQNFLTNLYIVRGGRPYLIKLGGDQPVELVVRGRPHIRQVDWISDSFNLVGFHASGMTFEEFFAPSSAHAGQRMFRLATSGKWQEITDPGTATMMRGEAYWVYCRGQSEYQGPVSIAFDVGDGLDFGRLGVEQDLTVHNAMASPISVTLTPEDALPTNGLAPPVAGRVPLYHLVSDLAAGVYDWVPLGGPTQFDIAPGESRAIRLAVRRNEMVAFTPPTGQAILYQSLLQLTVPSVEPVSLPVSAKPLSAPRVDLDAILAAESGPTEEGAALTEATGPLHPRRGLWVGTATVNAVSNPTSGSLNPTQPLPVASPFTFRLIVHVDEDGNSRLLQQVLQMWKPGAFIPNPDDPTSETFILDPNNPGQAVLLTDDSLIPDYSGLALRDADLVGRRVSTAAFGFRQPLAMSGDFGSTATALTVAVSLDYQDPLNPFKHRYHPDHDNWDPRYENVISEGKESFTVARALSLQFTEDDPEDLTSADWGDFEVGGLYSEEITGLHRAPIHVSGIFRLTHVSDVGVLNDGR